MKARHDRPILYIVPSEGTRASARARNALRRDEVRLSAHWRALTAVVAAAALAAAAGCGGSDNGGGETSGTQTPPPQNAKQGGDMTVEYAADTDNIDPGISYYQYGMNIAY